MGVRRVPFKDWVWETTGNTPSRWNVVSGSPNWTVQSNRVEFGTTGANGTACAPAEQGTQKGTIPQTEEMWFDVKMKITSTGVGPKMYFIFFASGNSGNYLTNSYLLGIDTTTAYFYRSDANSLTLLASTATTHTAGTEYTYIIHRNSDGDWDFTKDGAAVSALDYTDTTYTTGSYLGLRAESIKGTWGELRARYDYCQGITQVGLTNYMTKAVATLKFSYIRDDYDSSSFVIGDGIESTMWNGSTYVVDFYGRIMEIENCDEGPDDVICHDWRDELLHAEGSYSGSAIISTVVASMITSKCRVLTNGSVKTSSDTAAQRDIHGEYMFNAIRKLCTEVGYFIIYDGTGKLSITDTTSASGLTITDDDVAKSKLITTLSNIVNTTNAYHALGNTAVGGSGTEYNNYGRFEGILIDPQCPNSTQATARSNYYINKYKGSVSIIDVWITEETLNALKPGDTGTISLGWFSVSSNNFLVLEKEYHSESGGGIRLRLQVTPSTPVERHKEDYGDAIGGIKWNAQGGLGFQV